MILKRSEIFLARIALTVALLLSIMIFMSGCAQVESNFGGKLLGASVSIAGVTLAVSGTIPTGSAPAAAAPNASAP